MKRVRGIPVFVTLGFVVLGISDARAQQVAQSSTVSQSIKAIGYEVGGGATKVGFKGTKLMAGASGEAKVEPEKGATKIEVAVRGLARPERMGSEFLTYVLWAVSPEGRTSNLGEIQINNSGAGKVQAVSPLQVFSLIVTAEPYFSVRQPSEMVALENEVRQDTVGTIFVVREYQLMKRGQYEKLGNPLALSPDLKKVPLEMYQARNAVEIARSRSADKYAADIFVKAQSSLMAAENALAKKADKKMIISTARQVVQFAEDARALAVERQEEERIASERAAAAAKAKADAEAKAAAEAAEARRAAEAEARRQAELAAAREALIRAEAETARARAAAEAAEARRIADAEAARQAAEAAAREAQIRAEAAEARRIADAEAARQAAEAAAREAQIKAAAEAERVRVEAEAAEAKRIADAEARRIKAEAEAARLRADAEAKALRDKEEAARQATAEAERLRVQAEIEKAELREKLLQQFTAVLETKDTDRGLVVNVSDVLFDTGQFALRPIAREKLARVAGIVINYPGLLLAAEGHTDNVGSQEVNQRLSERRAQSVTDFLISQGVPAASITSLGLAFSMPVASNDTPAGRQQNRRVELIISGEVIGVKVGAPRIQP
ncbi:MAG TPA: OmpA family protein [Terriglobia bacterium]|nr:OmpA family protein [Terriglobia bacterium]